MPFNKSTDFINRHIVDKAIRSKLNLSAYIKIFILVLLFILVPVLNATTRLSTEMSGVLAQFQLILSVIIVVNFGTVGYVVAIVLNGISFINLIRILILGVTEATPGFFVALSTLICITIIYLYAKRIKSHIKELDMLNEELMALYKDLAAAETQHWHQNKKIAEFSRIVEESQKQLNLLTFYDITTGLPNRQKIMSRLELLIQISERKQLSFALVFINLDDFKHINDTLGHDMGDAFLKTASSALKEYIDPRDLLGHLNDDELVLLVQHKLNKNGILNYVNGMRQALNTCIKRSGHCLALSASFGIARYPEDGTDASVLLKSADVAVCNAKNESNDRICFFSEDIRYKIESKRVFEQKLMSSVRNNELHLVFQPLYHAESMQIRGLEALVRWNSPELGLVMPGSFIPVAEKTRYIIIMGEWILRQACCLFKQFQQISRPDIILSVNISSVQLMSSQFAQSVKRVLEETGLNPALLELEITESVLISSMEQAIRILADIKALGVKIALDDFGTGYSSLNYIQLLPIDTLKMDKSFIAGATDNSVKYQIVGTIIKLAHQMNMSVVAEGVENEQQLQYLKQNACDYLQGYLLSKPLDEQALTEFFNKQTSKIQCS